MAQAEMIGDEDNAVDQEIEQILKKQQQNFN